MSNKTIEAGVAASRREWQVQQTVPIWRVYEGYPRTGGGRSPQGTHRRAEQGHTLSAGSRLSPKTNKSYFTNRRKVQSLVRQTRPLEALKQVSLKSPHVMGNLKAYGTMDKPLLPQALGSLCLLVFHCPGSYPSGSFSQPSACG